MQRLFQLQEQLLGLTPMEIVREFEEGGVGKTFKQIADLPNSFILADDMDYPLGNKLPLWLIGFLY